MQLIIDHNYLEKENYNNPKFPVYARHSLLSYLEDYSALAHRHFDFEFNYIYSGEMEFFSQGETYSLKAGDLIFLNSNTLHYGYSEGKECEYLCVKISPLLLSTDEYFTQDLLFPFIRTRKDTFVFHNEKTTISYLEIVHDELEKKDECDYFRVLSTIYLLFGFLFKNLPSLDKGKDNKAVIALTKMVEFISKEYPNSIRLSDIAQSGYVTRNKACEIFKEYLKTTPNDYLMSLRLNHAKEMLLDGGKISDIAYSCGFSSASYFTSCYQKHYNAKPKEARKNKS